MSKCWVNYNYLSSLTLHSTQSSSSFHPKLLCSHLRQLLCHFSTHLQCKDQTRSPSASGIIQQLAALSVYIFLPIFSESVAIHSKTFCHSKVLVCGSVSLSAISPSMIFHPSVHLSVCQLHIKKLLNLIISFSKYLGQLWPMALV